MTVNSKSLVRTAENLTVADLSGEAAILDRASGRYFGLNEVGARVFVLAQSPLAVDELVSQISSEYDVAPEQLRDDVIAFISTMVENRLMTVS
jgi:hypothetical protein